MYKKFTILIAMVMLLASHTIAIAEQLHVVASIKPVHSLLSSLMKGAGQPELLVGKGKTPYGYVLSDEQKSHIKNADLLVWVGPELEQFLIQPVQDLNASTQLVTLLDSESIKVLPGRWDDDVRDPFVWLDTRNALILIDEFSMILMKKDPARTHLYKANRDVLFKKIAEQDRRFEYGYRGMKGGVGIEYYDTLQYFEQAYALKIAGVVSESPRHQVSAERLLTQRAHLADGAYACFFTEANQPMPDLSLLTDGITINQGELDSFGSNMEPGENLYFEMMEHNTRVIKQCLQVARGDAEAEIVQDIEVEPVDIGGHFMLSDHNGNLVTDKDMLGKYQLVYFGYTFCPDVCPTSLQATTAALNLLGDKANKLQFYFITVDPERDSVEVMAGYVKYFNANLIGLSGSRAMTDRVIKQYKVIVEKVEEEGADPDQYILDHTASIYLMAPDGSFITKFAHGISPQQMVEKINEYVPD